VGDGGVGDGGDVVVGMDAGGTKLAVRALRARLSVDYPELELRVLTEAPVAGAVALARRLLGTP